ncbi:MAG: NAD(P)/FAD-dependent oxidoreductase [Candidatus Hydrogenedentes bacterium]|nr:NAD(P)/FAD-dependent oxidoreductase [Candidatus Hydrogenedentota bacterium]
MNANKKYELVVIGGGSAGSTAAKWAVRHNISVALVERHLLGGTCLNYGCDPTKALLHVAGLLHAAKLSGRAGLRFPEAGVDWSAVIERIRQLIDQIRGGSAEDAVKRQESRGIHVYQGEASFVSKHEITVNGETLRGGRFLLATGSDPAVPPLEGLEETGFITNHEAVTLERLPKTLAVIGAGSTGTEFAQMFSRFGSRVTLFEMEDHILPDEETDLAEELAESLCNEGLLIETDVAIEKIQRTEAGEKRLTWKDKEGEHSLDVEEILVASGRKAALDALNLDAAGVATENGRLVVDETLRTSVPSIWAAGDITERFPFTHVAAAQALHAVRNAFSEDPAVFNYKAIPWAIFTDPALARVGATSRELEADERPFNTLEAPFTGMPRNLLTANRVGRVRLLVTPQSAKLLGAHILGAGADDLIAPVIVAMRHDLPVQALADTIFPYPTSSEAIAAAAKQSFK